MILVIRRIARDKSSFLVLSIALVHQATDCPRIQKEDIYRTYRYCFLNINMNATLDRVNHYYDARAVKYNASIRSAALLATNAQSKMKSCRVGEITQVTSSVIISSVSNVPCYCRE